MFNRSLLTFVAHILLFLIYIDLPFENFPYHFSIFIKIKLFAFLAVNAHLVANVYNWYHTSSILHLDTDAYKFKSNMNCLLLQNIPQPSQAVITNNEHIWSKSRPSIALHGEEKMDAWHQWVMKHHYASSYCIHAMRRI